MGPAEPPVFAGHPHLLFELFASGGSIERGPLQAAFDEHAATGRSFAAVLLDRGLTDQSRLLRAVAGHLGFDYADKLPEGVPAEIIGLVSGGVARSYGVVPVAVDQSALTLLVVDPFDPRLLNDLAFALGRDVRLAVADPGRVQALIRQYYGEENSSPEAAVEPSPLPLIEEPGGTDGLSEADIEKTVSAGVKIMKTF